jgi:peptide-methionine (S)-S-oxide reductase
MEIATLGGGCFWCLEAVYLRMKGVEGVVSGYMGGHVEQPAYRAVCEGTTGHAEVVQVKFDPAAITYRDVLEVFFTAHDPTTLNRQGNDVGTQYRSVIFFHSEQQEETARAVVREKDAELTDPVVTEVTPAERFWPAEAYHQDYFARNPHQPYCLFAVAPKVKKFLKEHAALARA